MKQLVLCTSVLALAGCTQYAPPSASDAFEMCVAKQHLGQKKVSVEQAHAIVGACEPELRRAALSIIRMTKWNKLGLNNPKVIEEYAVLKHVTKQMAICGLERDLESDCYRVD